MKNENHAHKIKDGIRHFDPYGAWNAVRDKDVLGVRCTMYYGLMGDSNLKPLDLNGGIRCAREVPIAVLDRGHAATASHSSTLYSTLLE